MADFSALEQKVSGRKSKFDFSELETKAGAGQSRFNFSDLESKVGDTSGPLKTAAKEGFRTAVEDVGFAATGGLFPQPGVDEQGRTTLPAPLVRGARVTGLPRTLARSAGVGISNLITGASGEEALERAGEALSPEFVPREGEGIASFVADVLDPRFLAFGGISGAARAGLKGKAALGAATKEGAAIGGGFPAINAAERGYIEPQDAINITLGTGIGSGFGLIFQSGINVFAKRSAIRAAQGQAKLVTQQTEAARRTVQGRLETARKEPRRLVELVKKEQELAAARAPDDPTLLEAALEKTDLLQRTIPNITREARTNVSQLKDFFTSRLARLKSEPNRLSKLSESERQITRELADSTTFEGRLVLGTSPGKDAGIPTQRSLAQERLKGVPFRKPPELIEVRSNTAPGEMNEIKRFAESIDDVNKEAKLDVPDFHNLSSNIPEGSVIDPAMSDVLSAARRASSEGTKPKIRLSKKRGKQDIDIEFKEPPPKQKNPTRVEQQVAADTAKSPAVTQAGIPKEIVESSPLLNRTNEVFALKPDAIPGSSGWVRSAWDRTLRSTTEVLRRMGNSGGELATKLNLFKDVPMIRFGELAVPYDRFMRQIPKRDWQRAGLALADVLEGKTPKYKKLDRGFVSFIQRNLQKAADEANALGIKVLRSDGKEVPFAERANYYPRVIKRDVVDKLLKEDNPTIRKIAAHMVKTKAEKNESFASSRILSWIQSMKKRRFGNLERAREIDLPAEFYDRNALHVIPDYFQNAFSRFEEIRQFGPRDEAVKGIPGKVGGLLDKIRADGGDGQLAKQIFERVVGSDLKDSWAKRSLDEVRALVTASLIQFPTTILQIGQFVTPVTRATAPSPFVVDSLVGSYLRAGKAFLRTWTRSGKEEADRAGQLFEGAISEYMRDVLAISGKGFGRLAEISTTANLFGPMDRFLRQYSSLIGKDWVSKTVVPRLLKNPNNKFAQTELRSLGLNPKAVVANKGINEFELNMAAKRFADNTQGAPSTVTLPLFWTSPIGKLLTQFKSFAFVVGRENVVNARNAVKTGNVPRLINMLTAYPMVGAAIGEFRREVFGIKKFEITGDEDADAVLNAYIDATGLTLMWDLGLSAIRGVDSVKRLFEPPSVGLASEAIAAGGRLLSGDVEGAARLVVPRIPIGGRVAQSLLRS